jgi:uncharacterized membrane protein
LRNGRIGEAKQGAYTGNVCLEYAYLPGTVHDISVASAQALLSAVASGMMALTAIVFSLAFVIVQFSGPRIHHGS